ncbi:hypothetical protein [Litorihabitans aurantiacus]|uniref:Uncharacterized protein n=1 Tax=Litorihabitans aurantiacus TaxID=1930061 RepID=A0AA37XEV1_9MICO|nr:hypothetical protein [Litorihabitans aurantiacus]GMA31605.1 hypothetical protein GCM10025875_15970 [Litorihabitans aurantiacus]
MRVGWGDILERWSTVMVDLHEVYGADWDDPGLVRAWPWWRARIWGLLGSERSRLRRELTPPPATARRG